MGTKLGIDVGGTFTDFLFIDNTGNSTIHKTSTTPTDPAIGLLNGIDELASINKLKVHDFLSQVDTIIHGTTITTNAVITGNFAKTGFITTKGFRDYLATRRGQKPSCYTPKEAPPRPMVPRYLRRVVEERIDCDGNIFIPLKEEDVYSAIECFKKYKVESVAVCLMFSFANPTHEKRVKQILGKELPGVYVCLSSDVLPQIRIYERASTTVFNACVGPILRSYIKNLLQKLIKGGFKGTLLLMQSNGGMMSPEVAMDFAVNTLLSGPAGGPKAGIFYGDIHGVRDIITSDMGGTSFDACLIRDRKPEVTVENEVAMFRMASPSLAIHSIGAGGGSLAYLDERSILCVGPQSAGAVPGPVCYGLGNEQPTVTDADLVLGYINPEYFLGGRIKVDLNKAKKAIEQKIASPLDLDLYNAAFGIYKLVNYNMAQGVKVASVGKGYDPRCCMLIIAGGAGPLHACEIAKELEIPLLLVPKTSSVFCASGMLMSNLRHDFISVCHMIMSENNMDLSLINSRYQEMKEKAFNTLKKERIPQARMRFSYACDVRYEGQFNEIEVVTPLTSDGTMTIKEVPLLRTSFDKKHEALYGYCLPGATLELICLRLVGEGIMDSPKFMELPFIGNDATPSIKGQREIYYYGHMQVPVYDGPKLGYGNRIVGPLIIEEPTTTIFLTSDYQLNCDKYGNYLIFPKSLSFEESLNRVGRVIGVS